MNIAMEKRADKTLLRLQEERLDAHNSPELKEYLMRLLESGSNQVIVDLSKVRFIDSSGLGALLTGNKHAGLHHGRFVLSGLHPRVQSMFELTRMSEVFEIHPSIDESLVSNDEGTSYEPAGD